MALHFVATSVISSEDGIGFGKEQTIESDEARNVGAFCCCCKEKLSVAMSVSLFFLITCLRNIIKQTRSLAERGSAKPLYEQLNEIQLKKQEEFEANKKKIFAPPKALDDEDVE